MNIKIHHGDIRDIDALRSAMKVASVVIHAAADTSGNAANGELTTVQGTWNVIQAASESDVHQLIHISSCSVYGIADCQPWQQIDETGPLEKHPEKRGAYSHAKFKSEQIALANMHKGILNITIIRPGTIWGPGGAILSPMIGFKLGSRLIATIGKKEFQLPLVYIDNLVSAIAACIDRQEAYDQVFNMVDQEPVEKNRYVQAVLRPLFPRALFFTIPYLVFYTIVACQETALRAMRQEPYLTRYRLISSQRPVRYSAEKLSRVLEWSPPVTFDEALHTTLQHQKRHGHDALIGYLQD